MYFFAYPCAVLALVALVALALRKPARITIGSDYVIVAGARYAMADIAVGEQEYRQHGQATFRVFSLTTVGQTVACASTRSTPLPGRNLKSCIAGCSPWRRRRLALLLRDQAARAGWGAAALGQADSRLWLCAGSVQNCPLEIGASECELQELYVF